MDALSDAGLGTKLRALIEKLDGGVEEIYRRAGLDYRPRYTPVMRELARGDALTIKAISEASGISHSAASQTVAKMLRNGLVEQARGEDARERRISIGPYGREILPQLQSYWRATELAAAAFERELSAPLSRILVEAAEALERTPFADRIESHIDRTAP